jgi:hypothetical protein
LRQRPAKRARFVFISGFLFKIGLAAAARFTYYPNETFVKTTAPLCREAEGRNELFVSTHWTIVLKAGDSAATSAQALSALSELCQIYWQPLYIFLRKRGYEREDAQDLTQGFSPT